MAFPAIAAAPLLAKAVGFAKGLSGLGIAKTAPAMGGFMKGAAARAGATKFAGKALADYMGPGGMSAGNIAMNFGPDILFGGMQGVMTPGDIGDKIIAGTTTAVGGAMGGVGAVGALGKYKNNMGARIMAEMGGGIAGDMVGQGVGDSVMRVKGGGTTPWEKIQQEGDQQYRQELERQILATYGLGGYNQTDLIGM